VEVLPVQIMLGGGGVWWGVLSPRRGDVVMKTYQIDVRLQLLCCTANKNSIYVFLKMI
jgi:hypothetical protein